MREETGVNFAEIAGKESVLESGKPVSQWFSSAIEVYANGLFVSARIS